MIFDIFLYIKQEKNKTHQPDRVNII